MSGQVLEPKLTAEDRKILAALPAERPIEEWCGPWEPPYGPPRQRAITVWELGESLLVWDVPSLLRTLKGLEHLGYVRQRGFDMEQRGRPRRWYRTLSSVAPEGIDQ